MNWIASHMVYILGALSVAGYLCGHIGQQLGPGRWRRALLIAASILPGDLVRAWRIGTSALGLYLVVTLTACSGSAANDAKSQMAVATYAQDELVCVTLNDDRDAAAACIAQVQARWCGDGGWLREAGGCGLQDAGGTDR